jgi:hypothetical protein
MIISSARLQRGLAALSIVVLVASGAQAVCTTPLIENEPLCNDALSDAGWPISHRGNYAQGSAAAAGVTPEASVVASHIDLPGPPITLAFSPAYGDGGYAIWGAVLGLTGAVVKIDSETFTLVDSYVPADEEAMPPSIPLGVSGSYSAVTKDFQYLLGRADFVEVYGDETPGDRSSPISLIKRVFLPSTAFCRASDLLVGGVVLPDGMLAVVTEQAVVSVMPSDPDLLSAGAVISAPSENGADCANLSIADEDLEIVSNSMAADENGGIYIVTDAAVVKYQWDGVALSQVWRSEYQSDPPFSVLRLGPGSGSTPSLMGTAFDDDRFVVITDGQELMHLVLMWRDEIPGDWTPIAPGRDPRIACEIPVKFGVNSATRTLSEQSVLVRGYSSVVVNNLLLGESGIPTSIGALATAVAALRGGDPVLAPRGAERIDWDPATRTCSTVWTNTSVQLPNAIPTMSAATGLMHAIGQRQGVWGLETLDYDTGVSVAFNPSAQTTCSQVVLDAVAGSVLGPVLSPQLETYPASCENSFFAATEVGPDGVVYTGTFQGASRFVPDSVPVVSPRRQARAGVDQGADMVLRATAALPADVDGAVAAARRGVVQTMATLDAVAAADGSWLDGNSAAAATALLAAAKGDFELAETSASVDTGVAQGYLDSALAGLADAADYLTPCAPEPQSDCRVPSKVQFAVKLDGAKSSMKWSWKSDTEETDLADPTGEADYALCVYGSGGTELLAGATIPADATLWQAKSEGYAYKDKLGSAAGVQGVKIAEKVGKGGSAKLKGKGAEVPSLALPATGPVVVQLVNSETGLCWDGVFDSGAISKNDAGQFKAAQK